MQIRTTRFITSAKEEMQYPASSLPEIAIVGRSNVGKSSLINTILNQKKIAKVSSSPGKTRLINFFCINDKFILVDLPGYGYAKVPKEIKAEWKTMIDTYLNKRDSLKGIISLLDIRHTPTEKDLMMINWIQARRKKITYVLTKSDKLTYSKKEKARKDIKTFLNISDNLSIISFSSINGEGKKKLLGAISDMIT